MNFTWDEDKNSSNFEKHRVRFEDAVRIFSGLVMTSLDVKEDYGEIRETSIGLLNGVVCIVVVHTDRDDAVRVISARRANKEERDKFDDYYKKNIS